MINCNSPITIWIVDLFTQVNSAEYMANFKSGHILLFLLHADVKMYKKSMKPLVNK